MSEQNFENEIIEGLIGGRAILFTGAGFSVGAINLEGRSPVMARGLSAKIAELISVEEDKEDLGYVSDKLISHHKEKIPALIELLKKEYSIKESSEEQNLFASIDWRRVYTTNYDQVFEMALKSNGKPYTSIDMDMKTANYIQQQNTCIHINGFIDNLKESDLDGKFKLSNSSYVSPDGFLESDWYGLFKRDLDNSSIILFVGYSLYDLDIEKILFSKNEVFQNKTYFIVGENCNERQVYKLSKYGKVIKKNYDFISQIIKNNRNIISNNDKYIVSSFDLCSFSDYEDKYFSDDDIKDFLVHGKLNKMAIKNSVLDENFDKYAIYREDIDNVVDALSNNDYDIAIGTSEFCNGKSVFCEQLSIIATSQNYHVYIANEHFEYFYDDLSFINKQSGKVLVIIDDYIRYKNEIKDFIKIKSKNIKLFLTARTSENIKSFNDIGIDRYYSLDLDYLKIGEINQLVSIFNGLGVWGANANLTDLKKLQRIKDNYESQISLALSDILNSEVVKNKTKNILSEVFNVFSRKTIFHICFFKVVGINLDKDLLDEIIQNKEIYDSSKINNKYFLSLFSNEKNVISGKSSIFCAWIIKNFFNPREIMNEMHTLAKYFDTRRRDFYNSYQRDKIFKSVLRFSFIERILPESGKRDNLKYYYDKLKNDIDWLKYDPHFWLQYAMAFMTFPDKYDEAQNFLDQAYSLADKKIGYSIDNIHNQQARLFIKQARQNSDGKICFDFFKKAHNLLRQTPNDVYKYRQMKEYHELYKDRFHILSKENKKDFLNLIKQSIKSLEMQINSQFDPHLDLLINTLHKITSQNTSKE
ncbi:SIR2 family protein [Moraxella nasibovis]|uniref:SIR2 family protein n=1 Tax=Moraxella nasibovis TaxID=2904120 RepID=UPI00240FB18D|nr:SIR2 family protein [Moraxella nasibovis]WFF38268.1 SIR2 family protein [Moraxella nasibovis]